MSYLAVDTETTGLNEWDKPFFISICYEDMTTGYWRFKVNIETREVIVPSFFNIQEIQEILDKHILVFHNANFDIRMLESVGLKVRSEVHDTMILSHVLTGGSEISYGLKYLSKKYLKINTDDEKELKDNVRKYRKIYKEKGYKVSDRVEEDYFMADPDILKRYGVQDVVRTMELFKRGFKSLNGKLNHLKNIYHMENNQLRPIIYRMRKMGMRIDLEKLSILNDYYSNYKKEQKDSADKEGGKGLNFNSSLQMRKKFYEELKFPVRYKMKGKDKGKVVLDGKTLETFTSKSKLAKHIVEWKAADSMLSSFINVINDVRVDDILYPNIRQVGTTTGRMSCSTPNLMNIPSDGRKRPYDMQVRIRELFIPREGHYLLFPDYSQMEIWILAYLSDCKGLKELLKSGSDLHGAVAKQIWGSKKDFNFKKHRAIAKNLQFAKLYGAGPACVAEMTDSTEVEAINFIDEYNKKFPEVKRFSEETCESARKLKATYNIFGRKYTLKEGFYRATNYIVQGAGAEILKRSVIKLDKMDGFMVLMTVHDEIIIEVPLINEGKVERRILDVMESGGEILGIDRLPVGMKKTKTNWSETEEVKL